MESTFSSFTQVLMPHKRLWSSTVSLCCMCTCLSICLFPFDCVLCCCGCAQRAGKTVKGCKVTVESLKQATPTRPREEYCSTLFVGELPGGVTKNQIRAHFSSAGKILKVRYYEKQHHGFVYFSNNAEAKKAMALADVPFSFGKDPWLLGRFDGLGKPVHKRSCSTVLAAQAEPSILFAHQSI
eukprot:TRINITY_DN9752_c0_g2_i5.p1 TRINITY_DN9752_c0_g2~~TRINITY_DN9752_c0_g2_i5.p1  ORF type:complete len:183 (+),score=25.05 TRINITY_DN9752_c0_g2_i5:151-699(+)